LFVRVTASDAEFRDRPRHPKSQYSAAFFLDSPFRCLLRIICHEKAIGYPQSLAREQNSHARTDPGIARP